MGRAQLLPRLARPVQAMMIRAAFEIIPPDLRAQLGVEELRLSSLSLAVVKVAANLAEKIPVRSAPPVQVAGYDSHKVSYGTKSRVPEAEPSRSGGLSLAAILGADCETSKTKEEPAELRQRKFRPDAYIIARGGSRRL